MKNMNKIGSVLIIIGIENARKLVFIGVTGNPSIALMFTFLNAILNDILSQFIYINISLRLVEVYCLLGSNRSKIMGKELELLFQSIA